MKIRAMTASDLSAVEEIAAASPEAAAWSPTAYAGMLPDPARGAVWIAEHDGVVAGFACFRRTGVEAELLNLAVHPAWRRKGLGAQLIARVIHEAVQEAGEEAGQKAGARGAVRIFVEVRQSNTAALRLYERFGFVRVGLRANYYPGTPAEPPEDAIMLARNLMPGDSSEVRRRPRQC